MIRPLFFLACAVAAQAATTITIRPNNSTANSGDAYNIAANPDANFGNSGALVVSGAGAGNTQGQFASVLKFDLAVATSAFDAAYGPGNWEIDSVQIALTAATPNNPTFNANAAGNVGVLWLVVDSWMESSITWNGLPGLLSGGSEGMGTLAYNGANSGTTLYTLDTALGFEGDLNSGGTASFYLRAADPDVSMVVNARNFGIEANRPALIITASPEPSRMVLAFVGLLAAGLRRRRGGEHARP